MNHSEKYDLVYKYYRTKLWDERRVRMAVVKNWITEAEFEEITGKPY